MKSVMWTCAAVFAALPLNAQALNLDCAVNPGSNNLGWVSDRYLFEIDGQAGTAKVNDSQIEFYVKKPVDGVVEKYTDKVIVVHWRYDVLSSTAKRFKIEFRGTYFRDTERFSLWGKPATYVETYAAQGRCTEN